MWKLLQLIGDFHDVSGRSRCRLTETPNASQRVNTRVNCLKTRDIGETECPSLPSTELAGCFSPLFPFAFLFLSFPSCRSLAGSLVHRCTGPGSVFFSLIIPLRAIARVN